MSPLVRNSAIRLQSLAAASGILTGLITIFVAFIAVRKVDLLSVLGLDVFFTSDGPFDVKSTKFYTLINVVFSFAAALVVGLFAAVTLKERRRREFEEAASDAESASSAGTQPDYQAKSQGPDHQTRSKNEESTQSAIIHLNKRIALCRSGRPPFTGR
jgi:hypothetical protein